MMAITRALLAPRCKNYRYMSLFRGLGGNAQGSFIARWKAHCRLPIKIIDFFASSHGCVTIKRNISESAFSEGVGHSVHKF